jgi:hypothetical protein
MRGNPHVRFGPGAVGKGPDYRYLADGLPVHTAAPSAQLTDERPFPQQSNTP